MEISKPTLPDIKYPMGKPDTIVDPVQLMETPEVYPELTEHKNSSMCGVKHYLPACYMWIDEGGYDSNGIKFLYAGRAVKIKNRIISHWKNSRHQQNHFLDRYYEDVFSQSTETYTGMPYVLIWFLFIEELSYFEEYLIAKCKPIYNIRLH